MCKLVLFKQDSTKSKEPIQKLASSEYFRALKGHKISKDNNQNNLIPQNVNYAIDKAVRQRMQQGLFGYDNSHLIALELELQQNMIKHPEFSSSEEKEKIEELMSQMLSARLEEAEKQGVSHKLSYEE